jgi:hypothetical protein
MKHHVSWYMCTNPLVSCLRFDPETSHIQSPSANHFKAMLRGIMSLSNRDISNLKYYLNKFGGIKYHTLHCDINNRCSKGKRQQNKLHIPSVRLSLIHRGVYYSSVKTFNQLPQNIFKYCNNIHTFKTLLRDYLVKNAFYSIEEFLPAGHSDVWGRAIKSANSPPCACHGSTGQKP